MKKFIIAIVIVLCSSPSFSAVTEVFYGMDSNSLKAGIGKYIHTRGGKVLRGDDYSSNVFQATEQVQTSRGSYTYIYAFNVSDIENGAKLDMKVLKASIDSKGAPVDLNTEKLLMDGIKTAIKGRFLYGLGFDFAYYDSPIGKVKAPKGRETGIVLTAVRYDALKKGLQAGDVITAINYTPLSQIPINDYASILNAKSLTDTLTLTYKRGAVTNTVTLTPRLSNTRVF